MERKEGLETMVEHTFEFRNKIRKLVLSEGLDLFEAKLKKEFGS